jgi:hypothetical protein
MIGRSCGFCLATSGLATLLVLCGCNVLGIVTAKSNGAEEVPAQYVPAKDSLLVLAESYGAAPSAGIDTQYLGFALTKNLREHEIAPTIDPKVLTQLRDANGDQYNKMTIDSIGRAVGAKQVLYVQIITAQVDQPNGGDQVRGAMAAKVRIVDSDTGQTRWPAGSRSGVVVQIQTEWSRIDSSSQSKIHDEMADELSEAIGKLFRSYIPERPPEMGKPIAELW